jgi:hypothetical protein
MVTPVAVTVVCSTPWIVSVDPSLPDRCRFPVNNSVPFWQVVVVAEPLRQPSCIGWQRRIIRNERDRACHGAGSPRKFRRPDRW